MCGGRDHNHWAEKMSNQLVKIPSKSKVYWMPKLGGWGGGGREGGRRDSNASEKYIQVIKKCVQLVHCNELTMIIKKTVTLPSVHNNGTLRNNNNDPKILHAVQN